MGNLGWTEILIILVIALIVFGPRKLPELGKSLGQSLAQFRRASEDFKRTWEQEVEQEKIKLEVPAPAPAETVDNSAVYGSPDVNAGIVYDEPSADATEEAAAGEATSVETANVETANVETANVEAVETAGVGAAEKDAAASREQRS